jgi:ankyrin repeat protein
MTSEWRDAVRRASVDELERLLASGADIDARDEHGQTALMLAAREGRAPSVAWSAMAPP